MDEKDIIAGFEDLFGGTPEPEDVTEPPEDTPEDPAPTDEPEDKPDEPEKPEDNPEDTPEDKDDEGQTPEDKQKARQNFEFARLRTENKKQATLIKNLGKVIGMDASATPDEIATKVQELIIQKQAKDSNVPVEMLQRIQELEDIAAENTRIKLENETQMAFTNLAEKYDLDSAALTEFATYLGENGKNPLEGVEVDIEAEYIKLHHEDIVKAAVAAALAEETQRQEKVDQHAGTRVPGSTGDSGDSGKDKIETVADLDKLFSGMEL